MVEQKIATIALLAEAALQQRAAELERAFSGIGRIQCRLIEGDAATTGAIDGVDIVLLFLPSGDSAEPEAIARFAEDIAPAPLLVVAEGIAAREPLLMGTGIEDCFDPNSMPDHAIVRATQRCIERAAQRVHVSTAERRYQALFNHMPVAAFTVDPAGAIVSANRAFLGLVSAASIDDIDDHRMNGLLKGLAAMQTGDANTMPVYRGQHILDSCDGVQKHVLVTARRSETGDAVPIVDVFVVDVTEREQQARRVVKAENRLRNLYDNVPIMMFEVDLDLMIDHPNRAMLNNLEHLYLEAGDVSLRALVTDVEDQGQLDDIAVHLRNGEAVVDMSLSIGEAESAMECLLTLMPARDVQGQITRFHGMLVDVTAQNSARRERDALHEQLQLTQKLESIGQLAAGIAHEINTPAQYVSDNLSFLMESFDDVWQVITTLESALTAMTEQAALKAKAAEIRAAMEAADMEYLGEEIPTALSQGHDGIAKIREIVLALKDFSHPGGGTMEPADINRMVESTLTVARNEWKYVAEVALELDEQLPAVTCFPSALSQVVLNIVVNAAHAIADARVNDTEPGNIAIKTHRLDDQRVSISIRDNGPGMPEAVRKKIFDPFFTTKEVGRGTGQGLAISRKVVVEQHSGKLLVDTEVGVGTEFRIELWIAGRAPDNTADQDSQNSVSGIVPVTDVVSVEAAL
ncbi:MAG: ATP-binding protein [Pseudomonadota bacterium]